MATDRNAAHTTLRFPQPREGVELQMRRYPRLRWQSDTGEREVIAQKRLVLGASADADIVLVDETISRLHALVEPQAEGIVIRDLSSRNGTFVNQKRVNEALIEGDAVVQLGGTRIEIDFESAVVAPVEVWQSNRFQHLVGQSLVMRELFALLSRIAPSDASVFIQAETGAGKEVVARSIHDASYRAGKPYVVVDCAALPENLLDSELFGHVKGSFTGALSSRAGAIETADGGTVFLDEIGELPLAMQPKLLRVLEQRTVRRVGETSHRAVDVRFVTATHRNLLQMVSRGEFREDLYFRLCVIPVTVPALRDRKEDIRFLAEHFLNGAPHDFSNEFFDRLSELPWRGNVRELRNYIERALALGEPHMFEPPSSRMQIPPSLSRTARRDTVAPPAQGFGPPETQAAEPSSSTAPPELAPAILPAPARTPSFPALGEVAAGGGVPDSSPQPDSTEIALGEAVTFDGDFKLFRERWLELGERQYLTRALVRHNRNVQAIAQEARVDRTYVYRLMRKYNL